MSRFENKVSEKLFGNFSSGKGGKEIINPEVLRAAPTSTLGAEVAAVIREGRPNNISPELQAVIQSLTTVLAGERREHQPWDSPEYLLGVWVSAQNELPGVRRRLESMGVNTGDEYEERWHVATRTLLGDTRVRTERTLAVNIGVIDMPDDPLALKRIAQPQVTLILGLEHKSLEPFSQRLEVELPCGRNQRQPVVWRYQRDLFATPRGLERFTPPRLSSPVVRYEYPDVAAERVIIAGIVDENNALKVAGVKAGVSSPRLKPEIEGNVVRSIRSSQEHVLDFRGATLDDVWASFSIPSPDLNANWLLADWTCQLKNYVDTFDPVYVPAIRAQR